MTCIFLNQRKRTGGNIFLFLCLCVCVVTLNVGRMTLSYQSFKLVTCRYKSLCVSWETAAPLLQRGVFDNAGAQSLGVYGLTLSGPYPDELSASTYTDQLGALQPSGRGMGLLAGKGFHFLCL